MSNPGASQSQSDSVKQDSDEIKKTEIKQEELKRKATLLLLQGKRAIYIRDYQGALVTLSEACQLFSQIYPELDDALADPYFFYGKALLEISRSESDILGDQMQDDADDDDDDDDDEVEENDDDGEKDGDSNDLDGKPDEKNSKSETCSDVSSNIQNGNSTQKESGSLEKKEEKSQEGKSKENSDEGEVNDLQLSWEYLELAKVIYSKKAEICKDIAIKLAETYLCLGENGLESENYSTAVEDIKQALELQKKHLEPVDRRLAETYYQLGIAYSLGQNYDEAIDCFKKSIEQLEKKISSLEMRKKMGDKKTEEEEKDAFYTMDGEISEIKLIIKDVEEKIKDMMESKSKIKAELLKQVYGSEQPSSSVENPQSSSAPASDISHLIKRKRKNENDETGEEKKMKTTE